MNKTNSEKDKKKYIKFWLLLHFDIIYSTNKHIFQSISSQYCNASVHFDFTKRFWAISILGKTTSL